MQKLFVAFYKDYAVVKHCMHYNVKSGRSPISQVASTLFLPRCYYITSVSLGRCQQQQKVSYSVRLTKWNTFLWLPFYYLECSFWICYKLCCISSRKTNLLLCFIQRKSLLKHWMSYPLNWVKTEKREQNIWINNPEVKNKKQKLR